MNDYDPIPQETDLAPTAREHDGAADWPRRDASQKFGEC